MICSKCGHNKPLTIEHWALKADGTPRIKECQDCRKAYQRAWWSRNKAKEHTKRRNRRGLLPTAKDYGDYYAKVTDRQAEILWHKIQNEQPITKSINTFVTSNIIRGKVSL